MTIRVFDTIDFDVVLREGEGVATPSGDAFDAPSDAETSANNSQIQASQSFEFPDNLIRYETEVQFQQGANRRIGENVLLKARIWDDRTGNFILRSDVQSVLADVYRVSSYTFNSRVWKLDDDWKNIVAPITSFADAQFNAPWKYDPSEYNFVWIPDQTERALPVDESIAVRLTIALTNGRLPIRVAFVI